MGRLYRPLERSALALPISARCATQQQGGLIYALAELNRMTGGRLCFT
jgi:hypothetical protein